MRMTREQYLRRARAYDDGAAAAASRQPASANPYSPKADRERFEQWAEGWHDQRFL